MSQAKPTVAVHTDAQATEEPGHNSSLSIGTASSSPKIRELKERYEVSRATMKSLDMTKPDVQGSGIPGCNTEDGTN